MATTSLVYIEATLRPEAHPEPSAEEISSNARLAQQAEPGPPNPPEHPLAPKPQSAYVVPKKPTAAPEPIGYLPFEAVDQAAVPMGDWMIDTDVMPPGRSLRVVLKLWISATGVIDHWELSGIAGDEEALARRALTNLSKTLFQPAFLDQVPVPSFRQLEIVLVR